MGILDNISEEYRHKVMEFYNETKQFEANIGVIIPMIFALIIAIGLVGNLLVVLVAFNRQMRNSTNILITGLACSDLTFLTLCVPFTAIDYASPVWIFASWMCNMINYLQHSAAYSSVWTLTLMAFDRYLAVCHPVGSITLRSMRNAVYALLVVNSVILLSQVPVARIHGIYEYDFIVETRSRCAIIKFVTGEASIAETRLYFFSFNIFGYVLPLGITCILYYFMLKRMWYSATSSKRDAINSSMRSRPETVRAKRKATRLVLCVVVIWALCWLPLNICFLLSGIFYPETLITKGGKAMVLLQIFSQVLAYTNSCLNPILYAFLSDNFRKAFLHIFAVAISTATFGWCCSLQQSNYRLGFSTYHNGSVLNKKLAMKSNRNVQEENDRFLKANEIRPLIAKGGKVDIERVQR